ncbi:SRPBCC family protein [Phycicoccus sp.]|uniref:SRPBCC family protein n=1 Tax=Phycicoccus sp. TaxID=1902410 RepID=UPI002CF8B89C|nr:SRPBCC family protein [Phycicoccus sp.]HMM96833.1 SRPBCC family protein [Phycicoccus sp.]
MANSLSLDVPAGVPWLDFTRDFDAPVHAVFDAHADPEKVRRWLGPTGYEMDVPQWDFVEGGGYRYVHRNPAGHEFGFRGYFHSVRPDELIVQTFEFDGMPDEVALEFMHFEDLGDGRTRLHGRSIGRTVEGRDAMVESGMESGMVEGYAKLDTILAAG